MSYRDFQTFLRATGTDPLLAGSSVSTEVLPVRFSTSPQLSGLGAEAKAAGEIGLTIQPAAGLAVSVLQTAGPATLAAVPLIGEQVASTVPRSAFSVTDLSFFYGQTSPEGDSGTTGDATLKGWNVDTLVVAERRAVGLIGPGGSNAPDTEWAKDDLKGLVSENTERAAQQDVLFYISVGKVKLSLDELSDVNADYVGDADTFFSGVRFANYTMPSWFSKLQGEVDLAVEAGATGLFLDDIGVSFELGAADNTVGAKIGEMMQLVTQLAEYARLKAGADFRIVANTQSFLVSDLQFGGQRPEDWEEIRDDYLAAVDYVLTEDVYDFAGPKVSEYERLAQDFLAKGVGVITVDTLQSTGGVFNAAIAAEYARDSARYGFVPVFSWSDPSGLASYFSPPRLDGMGTNRVSMSADLIVGSDVGDTIAANGGNDTVFGWNGADTLSGGTGNDLLVGDAPSGEGGFTRAVAGGLDNASSTNDSLSGGSGNDSLYGSQGNDSLFGEAGDDRLDGSEFNDRLSGGTGNDLLFGGSGLDSLAGDGGDDALSGGTDNDALNAGAGNDSLGGEDGNDTLAGGDGIDLLVGGQGRDRLYGGGGNDRLIGGTSNNALPVGSDSDLLDGGDGNDWLSGGANNDTLFGGDGSDTLVGGDGNDTLVGGRGNDQLDVGAGSDLIVLSSAAGSAGVDRVMAFSASAAAGDRFDLEGSGLFTAVRAVDTNADAINDSVELTHAGGTLVVTGSLSLLTLSLPGWNAWVI
jgi:Ca2+-binding RTX toxin-like protein